MAAIKLRRVSRVVETNCKLTVKEIPVCNDKVIKYTARMNKVTETEVKQVLSFVGKYVQGVITAGVMETAMIPYFGKFKPKEHEIRAKQMSMTNRGKNIILKAIAKARLEQEKEKKNGTAGS